MPRLFVAIDIPAEAKKVLVQFAPELRGARWVPADQLHLTLRFIGDVDPRGCAAIKTALASLSYPSFTLTMRGVGHFPPGRRARVLWVGLDPCQELMRLQQELELALVAAGIPPEDRPFSPHITLARLKEELAPASVAAFEERHRDLVLPPFPADELILYSSVLTPKGAIHRREAVLRCRK